MIKKYDRVSAVRYALKWAYDRNPAYYDFASIGGDCTNFASQCLFAGSKIMNYTPDGWYYINANDRSPSWTSVEFLYDFLITNNTLAVFGEQTGVDEILPGDIIQLGNSNRFYHTLVVSSVGENPSINNIKVCAHTFNAKNRPLNTYMYQRVRFIHIKGVYI